MIILSDTTHTLEITTSTTAKIDYVTSFVDITTTTFAPSGSQAAVSSIATTTIVAAPAASTQRQVKSVTLRNSSGSNSNAIVVQKRVSGTAYAVFSATLANGESIQYQDSTGWSVVDASGRVRVGSSTDAGVTGQATAMYKVGTATEAAGVWYSWSKDSGFPGAWATGSPGLNGRATDGTTSTDNGCIPIKFVGTNLYLTGFNGSTSVACNPWLFDVMWVNTGLVVTTTTAQAITPVALPARDLTGTSDGDGVWAGLLVTTATTNAGAVTNCTISYTNQAGTAGKTATMASFPATAVVGTVVWFLLAAGDTGVRSVESVTLGTSLVTGAVSLILARPLWGFPSLVANVGGFNSPPQTPGVRLYSGTCALPIGLMSGTGATTLQAVATVMER